jgi:hypothetical protein
VLTGFSGLGKTQQVVRPLVARATSEGIPAVHVDVQLHPTSLDQELTALLMRELRDDGREELAKATGNQPTFLQRSGTFSAMVRLSCWTSSSGCWSRRVRSRWNLWRARFERSHSALRTRAASGLFQTDLSIRDGPNRSTQRSLNRPLASTCNVSCCRASRWPVPKNGFLRIDEWKSSGVSARTPLLYGCSVICFGCTPWGVDLAGRCARSAGRTSVGEGDRAAIAAESERWSFKPGKCPPTRPFDPAGPSPTGTRGGVGQPPGRRLGALA